MSKLRFASMSSISPDSTRSATYAVEPIRPASSAPHHANRIRLRGAPGSCAISSAISISVPEPEPLSLMPGPSSTLSRWRAHDDRALGITLFGVGGDVVQGHLGRRRVDDERDVHRSRLHGAVEGRADGRARHHRGDADELRRADPERLHPAREAVVEHDHAGGAECLASWIFSTNVHVPRWIRAILPVGAGHPPASPRARIRSCRCPAHPVAGSGCRSCVISGAVTFPEPENCATM